MRIGVEVGYKVDEKESESERGRKRERVRCKCRGYSDGKKTEGVVKLKEE